MDTKIIKRVFNYNFKEKISKISLTDNSLFNWIYRLMYLQLLFAGFSILGGVVFGIFPAFAALNSCIRQILKGKNIKFFSFYKTEYQNSFVMANKIGFSFLSIIAIAVINLTNKTYFGIYSLALSYILYIAILYLTLSLVFSFAILSNYVFSFREYLTHSVIFPLGNIIVAISGISCILLLYTVFDFFPIIFFMIGISGFVLCMQLIFNYQIKKLERGNQNGNI